MSSSPTEVRLTLTPQRRFELVDVSARVGAEHGDLLQRHRAALYCSHHTTAGYLDQRLSARLSSGGERLPLFLKVFGAVFPPDAAYRHDALHLRAELSEAERAVEPRNGDSHLTFIGAGLRNCATYREHAGRPVYFIELDGVNRGAGRRRTTTVVGYDHETLVGSVQVGVPTSRHPIDAINLADPRLGLFEQVDELLARSGAEKARIDIALAGEERNAGLTVNEYETLLMQHDLKEVLQDPLRFAARTGRHLIDDPLAIPGKTVNYARYDVVQVLNSLIETFGMSESVVERLVARLMAVPARRLLRTRRVSFLASDTSGAGRPRVVTGTYQSPILVQWQPAEKQERHVDIVIVQFS
jgi:hypothetical protein